MQIVPLEARSNEYEKLLSEQRRSQKPRALRVNLLVSANKGEPASDVAASALMEVNAQNDSNATTHIRLTGPKGVDSECESESSEDEEDDDDEEDEDYAPVSQQLIIQPTKARELRRSERRKTSSDAAVRALITEHNWNAVFDI